MRTESPSARAAPALDFEGRPREGVKALDFEGRPDRLASLPPEGFSADPDSMPPFGSPTGAPRAPPPAASCASLSIPHVRQRSTWDCGVACLAAALLALADDRERRRRDLGRGSPPLAGGPEAASSRETPEPRRSARLAGPLRLRPPDISAAAFPRDHAALRAALCASLAGESVWTIDLAHLAARLGLRAELWTTAPGFTVAYASEPFYAPEAGVDRARVEALFRRAEEAGVAVREREASLGELFARLRGGEGGRGSPSVAIVLLDRNLLERLLRDERACGGRGDDAIERECAETQAASSALCERTIETGLLPEPMGRAQTGSSGRDDSLQLSSAIDSPLPLPAPSMPYAGHYVILVGGCAPGSRDGCEESRDCSAGCGCTSEKPKGDAPKRAFEPWPPAQLVLRDPAWPDRDRVVSTRAFERARKAYGTDQDVLFLSA